MEHRWTWTYLDADGSSMTRHDLPTTGYPTQSDAESWVGQCWQDLVAVGVDAVSLYDGATLVYGPMSLRPA